jgi:GNAT superfamily N-acetyltransferase
LDCEIREITGDSLEASTDIIRQAFGAATGELGITEENCPRFPAYTTVERLTEMRDRGARFFGAFADGQQVGIILVEKEEDGRYFAKRLAVIPEYWHRGLGEKLMARAIECIREYGDGKVNIAIVNEHGVLKDWYLGMGFREVAVKVIDFLPFNVGFLEKDIS